MSALTFGKHKSKTIQEVFTSDPRYCRWLSNQKGLTVDDSDIGKFLAEKFGDDDGSYVMTFGKYKGKTIKQIQAIDTKYLEWLSKNEFVQTKMPKLKAEVEELLKHIEGESTDTNLVELPSDLFASMTNLHTIHVSFHANLLNLPSLTGLKTLESVYFGYLDGIKEIPSNGDLPEIQVLALEALPLVRSLPDVAQYQTTLEMVFLQDVSICCSGFLSEGNCNTTFPTCCGNDPSTSTSTSTSSSGSGSGSSHDSLPRTCLEIPGDSNFLPSNATISLLNKFAANISNFCDAAQATCPSALMSTKMLQENACQGVLYRACSSESKGVGICFNEDMGPVECKYSRKIIEMRKAEIAAGCHCNKLEEQWLGCTG